MLDTYMEDDIRIIVFRNGTTNPLDVQMLKELNDLLLSADENESPKGLVLTGTGKFFSSGFDLPVFLNFRNKQDAIDFFELEETVLTNLFTCRKPVVSAINGHCVAGGLIFSMAADYRVAVDHPKIKVGMSEIKIGLPLTVVHSEVMRFGLDGNLRFRDILFFGEMIDVYRARELSLVDEIVSGDALIERAAQVVSRWMDTPARPFMQLKTQLREDTARRIRRKLADKKWHDGLDCFFNEEVRQALALVQASME